MRHFPVEPLLSSPTACRAGCYRRNAVVVADSKACPDLVVIRSGFCRVMKRLMVNRNDSPRQPDDATSMSSGASGRSGAAAVREHRRRSLNSQQRPPPPLPRGCKNSVPQCQDLSSPPTKFEWISGVDASNVEEVSAAVAASAPDAALTEQDEDKKLRCRGDLILKPGDVFGLSDIMFKDEKIHEVEDSAKRVQTVEFGPLWQRVPKRNEQVFEQNYYNPASGLESLQTDRVQTGAKPGACGWRNKSAARS
uniref:Cyclic nucleotide-binding domain-containing protein n=1 Tax=Macrostomum lignano TaxID=282301 RepID=A0A1I8F6H8_9PLAT